jgi:DNA-binding HxlR family transcriptional regulator/putative sterol carrier protein
MTTRSYDQFCGLAKALDVLGERWTLLVVRELLLGPQRYSDLLGGLPGIGTNLLASRLKTLEASGLVHRRKLPAPAASTVYELTERGRALQPAVLELSRWGLDLLAEPGEHDHFRAGWLVNGIRAAFKPELAKGVRRTFVLTVDGQSFTSRVDDGRIEVRAGDAEDADIAVSLDADTLKAIASGQLAAADAVAGGQVTVERGDEAEAVAFADLLGAPKAHARQSARVTA